MRETFSDSKRPNTFQCKRTNKAIAKCRKKCIWKGHFSHSVTMATVSATTVTMTATQWSWWLLVKCWNVQARSWAVSLTAAANRYLVCMWHAKANSMQEKFISNAEYKKCKKKQRQQFMRKRCSEFWLAVVVVGAQERWWTDAESKKIQFLRKKTSERPI